jgi:hypothetical protein
MSARETIVQVRFYCGAYVARGGGKTASNTVSASDAVQALARKLGYGPHFGFAMQACHSPSHSIWKITEAECS